MSLMRFRLLCAGALLVLAACGGQTLRPADWRDPSVDLAWPEPPDRPRIRYLRMLTGPADVSLAKERSGFLGWLVGERRDQLPLLTPYAVAGDGSGVLWVADNGARMLYRFDLPQRKLDYFQEINGIRLFNPSGVAVDPRRGRVFLADAAHPSIFVLDSDGEYLGSLMPPGGFKRPAGMAVDGLGQVYVVDVLDGSVMVFGPDGGFLRRIASQANPDGRFRRPLSVAIGPGGEVLVVDTLAFRVEVQDREGRLLGTIGRIGDVPGTFARPRGIAVDRSGHVFVSDAAFDNLQVFDLAGNLLMYFGSAGSRPGEFNLPAGVFADPQGRLFVADSYNHRVQVFESLAGAL